MEILNFRWSLAITFVVWVLMVVCYEVGLAHWSEFTFVHTLIIPTVLLVSLAPCSVDRLVSVRLFRPCWAGWVGVMIPTTYLFTRWLTGFGGHCDLAFVVGGVIAFSVIFIRWLIAIFWLKLDRSIQMALM